ncbi:MAG: tetratricopeptide repeat protein [Myxococcota bacterium]|jgi:tetratricopeptide (TPR) repeat protein
MKPRFCTFLAIALSLYSAGCTSTVVEKSARSQDPAVVFEEQMKRAERFHRRDLIPLANRHYAEAIRSAQAFPPDDPRRSKAHTQRAELRLAMGDYTGAEEDYRAIIKVERLRARTRASLELSNALNNLAVFLIDLDRIPEVEPLLTEALSNRIEIFGEDHPMVAVLLQNYADSQRRARNYPTAEQLFVRALSIYVHSDKEFFRQAAIAQNGLALVFAETHRPNEAERNHVSAIRLSIKAGGEHNPDIGVFSRDLANLYTQEGRTDEAEGLYKGSIAIFRDKLGEQSYQLSKSYRAYSKMLASVGRRREAAYFAARADATGF